MEEPPGGYAAAGQDQITRFTAKTVAARDARVAAWVLIALGVGCILFGGMFFAAKHSGHDVVATVTHEGPCSNGACNVDVVYDTAGGQVSTVMYGVPSDEIHGPPAHRLLKITYQSGGESDPTTNDMPDAIWIGFGAAGLASAGWGAWLLRRKASPRMLAEAAGGAAVDAADTAALTPALADRSGPGAPARTPGRGLRRAADRSGAITIAERFPRWWAVTGTLLAAVILGSVVAQDSRIWLARGHILAAVAYLVIGAASVWGCSRSWRIRLWLGDGGVTVRNYFRTYRISWPEVLGFADGSVSRGEAGRLWALNVVLRDGRVVTASGTSSGKRDARPETLTAIRQAAERWAIQAKLAGTAAKRGSRESPANPGHYPDPGGQPGLRYWDGKTWSPFLLRADPAIAEPDRVKAPAEVWSPLAGSDPQWHDAARRAWRAGIMIAVWLAVTAVAGAVTLALYVRDAPKPHADFTLDAVAGCATVLALSMALIAWERRKNLKKIDQAAQAAAGPAKTRR